MLLRIRYGDKGCQLKVKDINSIGIAEPVFVLRGNMVVPIEAVVEQVELVYL